MQPLTFNTVTVTATAFTATAFTGSLLWWWWQWRQQQQQQQQGQQGQQQGQQLQCDGKGYRTELVVEADPLAEAEFVPCEQVHTISSAEELRQWMEWKLNDNGDANRSVTTPSTACTTSTTDENNVLMVDANHSFLQCVTHHPSFGGKANADTPLVCRGDTSTGIVLRWHLQALKGNISPMKSLGKFITSNHFDIDAVLSVFCIMYPKEALENGNADVIERAAEIGDFRAHYLPSSPRNRNNNLELHALRICCAINRLEKQWVSGPFEGDDAMKWPYFLRNGARLLKDFIRDPDSQSLHDNAREEFDQVMKDDRVLEQLCKEHKVRIYRDIGLCVVEAPEPMHYYSLHGIAADYDCDTVLALFSEHMLELEQRYTGFVELWSRKVLPKVDLAQLAQRLNNHPTVSEDPSLCWHASKYFEPGPILRLDEKDGNRIQKALRYGHPYKRPIYNSNFSKGLFENIVVSFLRFGLRGADPMHARSPAELRSFNESIDWSRWEIPAIAAVE